MEENEKRDLSHKTAMKYFTIGHRLYNEGYFQEAIEPLEKAIDIDNEFVWAYNILGNAFSEIEIYHKAVSSYKKGLEINPDNHNILFHLGNLYYTLDLHKNAMVCFKKVQKIDPDHPWVDLSIADLAYDRSLHKTAKKHYLKAGKWWKKMIEANDEVDYLFNLSHIYERLGILFESDNFLKIAIITMIKYLNEKPNDLTGNYKIGFMYCSRKNKESALKHYDILKSLDKDYAEDLYESICML